MQQYGIRIAAVGLCLLLTAMGGCVPGGGYEDGPCPPMHPGERTITTDEIDAAGRLAFDDAKTASLSAVARRPGLLPADQAHLVCVALRDVAFDDSRVSILTALIRNPDFAPRGKSAILQNLQTIAFDDSRAELLREMEGRGEPQPFVEE